MNIMRIMLKNPSTEKINWNNSEIHDKFNERQKKNRATRKSFNKTIEKTVK